METGKNEEQKASSNIKEISTMAFKEFEDDLQEPEQKSVIDLSSKKVQKKNKELSKQNTQLVKSIDALKKEREELLSDKNKLKSENKTLERELRKVNSKGEVRLNRKVSQMSVDIELDSVEDMTLKIQSLEAHLAEKDQKLIKIRERLQRFSSEMPDISLPPLSSNSSLKEGEMLPEGITQNGGILDSSVVEIILDEHNETSNLQVENIELRAKVASLENTIAQLQSALASKDGGEGKTRKKSGNFFRRGKTHSKSMTMKHSDEIVHEKETVEQTRRSKSPDILCMSDSYQDMSGISLVTTDPKSVGSLPSFIYAGLSPRTATKRAHGDLQTLQSCLKVVVDEKKQLSEQNKQLEAELVSVKQKIKDQNKQTEEKEQSLQKLECARELLFREKKDLLQQVSTLKLTNDQLKAKSTSLEKQHKTSCAEKDAQISNFTDKVTKLTDEVTKLTDEVKKLKEKLYESESIRKESEDVFVPSTTPNREIKPAKTVTVVTKPPPAPVSQKKLHEKEGESDEAKTRKTSQSRTRRRSSSSSLSNDEHVDSVANTRALFEQKIVSFKDDNGSPKRSARKLSCTNERRGSYSNTTPILKPVINHAKSSSFDTSTIEVCEDMAKKTTTPTTKSNTEKKAVSTSSTEKKTVSTSSTDDKVGSTTTAVSKPTTTAVSKPTTTAVSKPTTLNVSKTMKSFTSTNQETTPVSKVSKIIIKSTASPTNSPVNGQLKSLEKSINTGSIFQKQASVPVITTTVHTTSSPTRTIENIPRSISLDSKKDKSLTTVNGKRTIVQPIKSNSVILTSSFSGSSTPTASKVTVTTSSAKTNTDSNKRNSQRPQSVLLTPPSLVQKASSMQDIPEQISSESTNEASPPRSTKTGIVSSPERSPVPRRYQRRERNERPKTMYAGRAETTNLVNLISRFQQQESTKSADKNTDKSAGKATSVTTPVQNKVFSPTTPISPARKAASPPPSKNVVMRNPTSRASRPQTYYGAPSMK